MKVINNIKYRKLLINVVSVFLGLLLIVTPNVYAMEIVINGNSAGSGSEVSVQSDTSTQVNQTNNAEITNQVDVDSNTGDNTASSNSGDTAISTGDATSTVAIENTVNSSSAENVGCCEPGQDVKITGNGADSQNTVNVNQNAQTNVSVDNFANITNSINGNLNTGNNTANSNGGDVNVSTGDITVNGKIINGPINVSSVKVESGVGGSNVLVSGNAANSFNFLNLNTTVNSSTYFNQNANFSNSAYWDLNTGGNSANGNMGDVNIVTGDIFFDFLIENIANIGGVEITCCSVDDPGDDDPGDDDPGDDDQPNENENGVEGSSSSSGGSVSSEAASTGPGVIGLSDTDSNAARTLFFWIGIVMLTYGLRCVSQELSSKKFAKRWAIN